jgi:uncharacterized protein YprB with RNaseH-like and TPR domain
MNSRFDKFARVSALRPAMKRARLVSSVTGATASPSRSKGESILSALLGGACERNHFGEHFVVRRWYAQPEPCSPLNGALELLDPRAPRMAADPERWLFLDTETTGLAGGTGTYAFLVGLAWWDAAGLQVEQFFLRDYDDEHSMLTALAARLAERPVLVTFNGKSFDWPLLETRYRMTRSIHLPEPAAHLDLLHPARQVWRLRLGSVRLSELERSVLGAPCSLADWDRSHDVRSEMIPHIYFDYLRGGSPVPLLDVFRHNQMDLRGLAAIAVRMAALLDDPEAADAAALDLYGLARLVRQREQLANRTRLPAPAHASHPERRCTVRCSGSEGSAFPDRSEPASSNPATAVRSRAQQLCERALAAGLPAGLDRAALRDLAALAKRQRDFPRACALWHQLAFGTTSPGHPERSEGSAFLGLAPSPQPLAPTLDSIEACEQLAIHYEHRAQEHARALDFARRALAALRPAARAGLLTPAKAARLRSRLDRRIARLQRKLSEGFSPRPSGGSAPLRHVLIPETEPQIARTPLRRASNRPLAESNGHALQGAENPDAVIPQPFRRSRDGKDSAH